MTKSLQESANRLSELDLLHPGILDQALFERYFSLHCYAPSPELSPFVTHIFTQRIHTPPLPLGYRPLEILSGPNMYLFFTPQRAFVHTITSGMFEYDATALVVAGVKFRPGGFRAFFDGPLSALSHPGTLPMALPTVDEAFCQTLLAKNDREIVHDIEKLLCHKKPIYDNNIAVVERVIKLLEHKNFSSVEALAHELGRSERSVQLLFQRYVGVGAKWVITRRRLLRVLDTMSSLTPPTWSEAALEAGYSTPSHFSNDFKAVLNISPTEYMKTLRFDGASVRQKS